MTIFILIFMVLAILGSICPLLVTDDMHDIIKLEHR